MSSKLYANVVAGIPYGNEGKKRWVKVGVLLQMEGNDGKRGPGLVVMLDRHFNPAGVPLGNDPTSVALSTYWPDDKRSDSRDISAREMRKATGQPDPLDDDIPF